MKNILLPLLLLFALPAFAQEPDLIVTTKLDSIECKLKKVKEPQITYLISEELKTISTDDVYLVKGKYWKRPKYFNTDVDFESIMVQDIEMPPNAARKHMAKDPIEPWRKQAGNRLKGAGALVLGSVALSLAGTYISTRRSNPSVHAGMAFFIGSGVCYVISAGLLLSAGNAMAGK